MSLCQSLVATTLTLLMTGTSGQANQAENLYIHNGNKKVKGGNHKDTPSDFNKAVKPRPNNDFLTAKEGSLDRILG